DQCDEPTHSDSESAPGTPPIPGDRDAPIVGYKDHVLCIQRMHFDDGTAVRVKVGCQQIPGGTIIAADHRTRICSREHVSWILVIEFNAPYRLKCSTVCDAPSESVRIEAI